MVWSKCGLVLFEGFSQNLMLNCLVTMYLYLFYMYDAGFINEYIIGFDIHFCFNFNCSWPVCETQVT